MLGFVIEMLKPASILDLGCGVGTWLKAAGELGVEERVGIDGNWANEAGLLDQEIEFHGKDLNETVNLGRSFDLAISLEVAEHLKPQRSQGFVDDLCRHADIVLFGAAIPGQGGENHINERYQSHWVSCFRKNDYICVDCIRPVFWNNENVGVAYRQNVFLYFRKGRDLTHPGIVKYTDIDMPDIIHPIVFERHKDHQKKFITSLKNLVKHLLFMKK